MLTRLQHDCVFAIAWRSLETVKTLLREEEWRDFLEEVMLVVSQEMGRYEEAKARQEARLRPGGESDRGRANDH
jgi:hypothetical protein